MRHHPLDLEGLEGLEGLQLLNQLPEDLEGLQLLKVYPEFLEDLLDLEHLVGQFHHQHQIDHLSHLYLKNQMSQMYH